MPSIDVTIGAPDPAIAAPWADLIGRAPGNAFMSPPALAAAAANGFAKIHMLAAWDRDAASPRLVGLWALADTSIAPVWPTFLSAPPYDYAFLSNPVVDPAHAGDVMAAFLDAIAADPRLPNVVSVKDLDAESAVHAALLAGRAGQTATLRETVRPFASRETGVKRSGSTAKKMRQDWNRLSALGCAEVVNDRTPGGAREAFEIFLKLEAGSWKGGRGTALLCAEADAAFARRFVGGLADERNASVALLRLDRRVVAAQVLLYCGPTAYTWKTAFDAEFARFSPGALLVDKVAEALFSSGDIETIDSCAVESSFMARLWPGRRRMVDMLVDVGPGRSLGFTVEAMRERGYAQLRELRDKLRAVSWPHPSRKGKAAA